MTTLLLTEWRTSHGLVLTAGAIRLLQSTFRADIRPTAGAEAGEPLWDVTPGETVGVASEGFETVAVRPKIAVANVLFLLSAGLGRDPWEAARDARLADASDLTSAIASLFVHLCEEALAGGVLRGYRGVDADLMTVRGRVDLATQLRRRPGLELPLAVSYVEHDADILENRLLRAAARALSTVATGDAELVRGLRRVTRALADVTDLEVIPTQVPLVHWTRLNERYRSAVELARIVLARSGLDAAHGPAAARSLTLDMNRVFEEFVCTTVGRRLVAIGGGVAQPQDGRWHLDVARSIRIRPDLVWYRATGAAGVVLDAKYKSEKAGGYPDADLYQVHAYCTALDLPRGHLVYARGDEAGRTVRVVNGGPTIEAHALDLEATPARLMAAVEALSERIAADS